MKKMFYTLLTASIIFSSCQDDDDITAPTVLSGCNDPIATNYNSGALTFGAWDIVLPAGVSDVTSVFVNKANSVSVSGFGSTATAVSAQGSNGADTSAFNWTFSNIKAGLGY